MDLYLDGQLRTHEPSTEPIIWRRPGTMWLGREDSASGATRDFGGELDDFRIYTRALTVSEVASLAAGAQ
jgi:hypothetical protein